MNNRIIRPEPTNSSIPLAGTIHIGMKVKNENNREYPISLDYFIASGPYKKLFDDAFGEKPNSIGITFMDDNPITEQWQARDSNGKLVAFGDGVVYKYYNAEKNDYLEVTKDFIAGKTKELSLKWHQVLIMTFIIPKITGLMARWRIISKADKSSIPNIIGSYDKVLEMAGTCKFVPFELNVKKHKSDKPGGKSYSVIQLVANVSLENIELIKSFAGSVGNRPILLTDDNLRVIKQTQLESHTGDTEDIEFTEI